MTQRASSSADAQRGRSRRRYAGRSPVALPPVSAVAGARRGLEVADHLRRLIVDGGLRAGDRLPTEAELANQFGVSRVTARDALQMLRGLGLVEAWRGRGTFVAQPDANALLRDLTYFSFTSDAAVDDLFEVRTLLEMRAALRASRHQPAAERRDLLGIVERMAPLAASDTSDAAAIAELDATFHLRIAELSGNLVLEQMTRRIMGLLEVVRARSLSVPGQRLRSWEQHRSIAEAIEQGEAELASARVVEHVDSVRRAVLSTSVRHEAPMRRNER